MRIISWAILFIAISASALAGQKENAFHPLGPVDLYTGSMTHFDLHLGVGDNITAVVPQIGFQYGFGNFSAGLDLGLSCADVDNLDSEVWPGNIALNIKGKHCLNGSWKTCFGGEFSLGLGFADLDTPNPLNLAEWKESAAEAASQMAGFVTDLRGRMFAAGVEHFVFEPILAASTTNGMFIFHAYFGMAIYTPLDDLVVLGFEADTDNEAAVVYGLSMGGVMGDLFGGTFGFRGLSTVTLNDDESYFSLDFTLRLLFGGISPVIRFAIPLDDNSQDVFDVVITFGVTAEI